MIMLSIPEKLIFSKDSNKVFISHVGDHEYSFNIFGGVYTDKVLMFFSFLERSKLEKEDIIFTKPKDSEKDFSF